MFAVALTLWGAPVTWLEIVAFGLSVWMVLANLRVHVVAWPLAIASSVLYALLFANSKLYGEASLQLFFVLVSVWGWRQWLHGTDGTDSTGSTDSTDNTGSPGHHRSALHVRWMQPRQRRLAAAATLAAWPALGLLLQHTTDSDVPFLDALPTTASITAQILLGRKFVENWPLWVAVNIASVALFAYKGLWLTVILYGVFAVLAVIGWRGWAQLALEKHGV